MKISKLRIINCKLFQNVIIEMNNNINICRELYLEIFVLQ